MALTDFDARGVGWDQRAGNAQLLTAAEETVRILCLERQPQDGRDGGEGDVTLVPVEPQAEHFLALPGAAADHAAVTHAARV